MNRLRTTVALPWIVAVLGFPIGGYVGHAIAGPAATAGSTAVRSRGPIIGLGQAISVGLRSHIVLGVVMLV